MTLNIDRNQSLARDLDETRRLVVSLMPKSACEILSLYYRAKTRREIYEWQDEAVDKIVAMAVPLACGYDADCERAACPLCGSIGYSLVSPNGFLIPTGLERHLRGTGNARECPVMKVAVALAYESFERNFGPAEEAERKRKAEEVMRRSREEVMYRASPFSEPRLPDEDSVFGRSAEQIAFAEQRVAGLGFHASMTGNIKSWSFQTAEAAVFADVCQKEEIVFKVFRKPLPKSLANSRRSGVVRFVIPHRWKHNLPKKFMAELEKLSQDNQGFPVGTCEARTGVRAG